jgi:hypothetical protein
MHAGWHTVQWNCTSTAARFGYHCYTDLAYYNKITANDTIMVCPNFFRRVPQMHESMEDLTIGLSESTVQTAIHEMAHVESTSPERQSMCLSRPASKIVANTLTVVDIHSHYRDSISAYGLNDTQRLAMIWPEDAMYNADNYAFYAIHLLFGSVHGVAALPEAVASKNGLAILLIRSRAWSRGYLESLLVEEDVKAIFWGTLGGMSVVAVQMLWKFMRN